MAESGSLAGHHDEFRPDISRRHFAHRRTEERVEPQTVPAEAQRMSWSWRVGRIAGIDVYLHATFLLLIVWLVMRGVAYGSSPQQITINILFVMSLFMCVVLHEYGHALTARRYGIRTRDITLLPIGGVARLERIPKVPYQELIVALAGPAVNVVIAGVLWSIIQIFNISARMMGADEASLYSGNPIASLMYINLVLVVFNLLPAFPMDGGRVLRALLAMKIPRIRATQIAAGLGQVMAVLFALVGFGILGQAQPFLIFIALFVYLGAMQEYQTIRWEAAVEGLTSRDAMVTNFRTLVEEDPMSRAVSLLLQGTQHDFPVLDDNFRVVGLLLRQDLIATLSKDGGAQMPVKSAMREKFAQAEPDEPLVTVFERMQGAQLPIMPVFDPGGKLVGLLTMENVAEVVMVRNALEKAQSEHERHERELHRR